MIRATWKVAVQVGRDARAPAIMATPRQAAKQMARLSIRLESSILDGLGRAQARVHQAAVERSSGTHSTAELRKLARQRGAGVYSVRRPDNRYDPTRASAQTGAFRRSWRKGAIYKDSAGDAHAPVSNTDSKAGLFDGDPHGHMRGRDIAGAVVKQVEQSFGDRIQAAIRRTIG